MDKQDLLLEIGIEILASMKAKKLHGGNTELGRRHALLGTEPEHYGNNPYAEQHAKREKERLYAQARFSATVLLKKLQELGVDLTPLGMRPCHACQGEGCPTCNGMGEVFQEEILPIT